MDFIFCMLCGHRELSFLFALFFVAVTFASLRPEFHALPPSNWINDPNGPIFYGEQYHLFFQYNPDAAVWGNITWGHMISPDMIHWEWEGIALSPGDSVTDADHGGCWTGSSQIDTTGSQLPTIIYTAVRFPENYETQMLAVASDDNITSWVPLPTPVIESPPYDSINGEIAGFRDPSFWFDNELGKWRMIIGSGIVSIGGTILQYTADELQGPWTFIKPLITGNTTIHGDMWECPDLFELSTADGMSSSWVLIFGDDSIQRNFYMIGRFDTENNVFIPAPSFAHGRILDAGNFYASKTMLDSNTGERILWGWSPEDRSVAAYSEAGWAGIQTIPRVLKLSNDLSSLLYIPVHSLSSLYNGSVSKGNQLDITLKYNYFNSSKVYGVKVLKSLGGEEFTLIGFDPLSNEVFINREYSSLSPEANKSTISSAISSSPSLLGLELQIIIDHSIIEVFANGNTCITGFVV